MCEKTVEASSSRLSWWLWLPVKAYFYYLSIGAALFFAMFVFLMLLQFTINPVQPSNVSADISSEWGRYFLAETGFPVIKVDRGGYRKRIDSFAFVGSNRPESWFIEHGFKILSSESRYSDSNPCIRGLDLEGAGIFVIALLHPKDEETIFSYDPKSGLLIMGDESM